PTAVGADLLTGQVLLGQLREVAIKRGTNQVGNDDKAIGQHQHDHHTVENPEQPIQRLQPGPVGQPRHGARNHQGEKFGNEIEQQPEQQHIDNKRNNNEQPQAGLANQPERSEEHTSELQSRENLVCRLLLEKKKE